MSRNRKPRTIDRLAGGPDKRATDLNNALYVIQEFVSPRRLATLATVPTSAQLVVAVDLYVRCERNPELLAHAHALRAAAETWADREEVPESVHAAAKAILSGLGPEPPGGWDAHDGYYHPEAVPEAAVGSGIQVSEASERAAYAAQTMMHALNLAAVLASPRPLQKATEVPPSEHLIEHLDALIGVLSTGDLSSSPADIGATREAALRLRARCAMWSPGPEAPTDVQEAARQLLAACGVPEPPGGWDAFQVGEDG